MKAPAGAARVDLTGKTIVPALVDAHVHLGYQVGLNFAAENFTRETLVDQLNRYVYSGVAAVLSLGTEPGDLPAQIRAEQTAGRLGGALFLTAGRGIAAPNAGPGTPELKAAAYGVVTEDDARRAVREQVAHKVDFIKIWVDDRNGTVQARARRCNNLRTWPRRRLIHRPRLLTRRPAPRCAGRRLDGPSSPA